MRKPFPVQVLPTTKLDKSPVWSDWRLWGGEIEPGFFYSDDLAASREYLHAQGHVPKVSVTHKRELRKLVVQLGTGRLVIRARARWARVSRGVAVRIRGQRAGEATETEARRHQREATRRSV